MMSMTGDKIICTHGTKALLIPMLRDAMSFSDRTDRLATLAKILFELDLGKMILLMGQNGGGISHSVRPAV